MWQQTLFSAKNRNLSPGAQRMDEYHILTADSAFDSLCRNMTHRVQKSLRKAALFIERSETGVMLGRSDMIGTVLGMDHEYAREFDFGDTSGLRRATRFGHAYHTPFSDALKVPCHNEMLSQQSGDLLHILSEAHAGREPVAMPPVQFTATRQVGTDWDRIAREVEAGRSRGGLFDADGKLIEQFESIADKVSKETQKKTASQMDRQNIGAIKPKGCRVNFMTVAAVSVGVALAGWAAWHLIQTERKKAEPSSGMMSR